MTSICVEVKLFLILLLLSVLVHVTIKQTIHVLIPVLCLCQFIVVNIVESFYLDVEQQSKRAWQISRYIHKQRQLIAADSEQ